MKPEVTAIVPIMRLRRRNSTVGVSQLIIDGQIESKDIASSNMIDVCLSNYTKVLVIKFGFFWFLEEEREKGEIRKRKSVECGGWRRKGDV